MEIKPDRGRESETAHVALATVAAMWPATAEPPLVSSFSRTAVAAAKESGAPWSRSLLFDRRPEDWQAIGQTLGLFGFGANQAHLDGRQVAEMRNAGYRVSAYTVNSAERASLLFAWGVDAVFTDAPGPMLAAFPGT
jgi:glycerophosphoryl diester phosphodiesterase